MTTAAGTTVAMIDGIDVDAVAVAVRACPAVSGLYGGRGDAIASYLPGRRVPGVEVANGEVTVHVRSRWAIPAAELLSQVAAGLRPVIGSRPFQVVVEDIDDPDAVDSDPRVARAPVSIAPVPVAPVPIAPVSVAPVSVAAVSVAAVPIAPVPIVPVPVAPVSATPSAEPRKPEPGPPSPPLSPTAQPL